ncbi:hypothetical protein EJB05_48123, partial [Eragrostis curvula]
MPSSLARLLVLLLATVAATRAAAQQSGACAAEKFSSNRVYAACSDLPRLGASVHWTYDAASSSAVRGVRGQAALRRVGRLGAQPHRRGHERHAGAPRRAQRRRPTTISGYSLGSPGKIAYDATGLAAELGGDGRVRMFGTLKLQNGTGEVNQVWQVGPGLRRDHRATLLWRRQPRRQGEAQPGHRGDHRRRRRRQPPQEEKYVGFPILMNKDGQQQLSKEAVNKQHTHGVLNAVSWGLLLPMGAIFARYLKTFKSADPAWFYLHVIGYAVGVSGWATGIHLGNLSQGITYSVHRSIGIAVFALGTLQIFALFLRPKPDHKFRFYWNVYHHSMGYAIIILGIINIFKGMTILNVAQKWKTAYIIAICILGAIALILEAVTWLIVLKRRKSENKTYNGTSNGNGNGRLPLSM